MKISDKQIISIDSDSGVLNSTFKLIEELKTLNIESITEYQKIIQQLKIANVYKAYETDLTVDSSIFDTDDTV